MLTKINSRIKRRQKGFTLIELLLVVAILAVLAFLAVPAIATTIRNARVRTCASNEIMIEQAGWRWYADNVALGNEAPFGVILVYVAPETEGGALPWQEWVLTAYLPELTSYFRPSAAPTCPFGAFAEGEAYEIWVQIGLGNILEDVLVICPHTYEGTAQLHDRAVDRPSLPAGTIE